MESFVKKKTKLNQILRNNINLFATSICELIHKYILLGRYQHLNFVGMPVDRCDSFEVYSCWRIGCQATT